MCHEMKALADGSVFVHFAFDRQQGIDLEARGDLADDFSRVRFRQFPLALEQPEQGASRQQLKNQLHLRGRFEGVDKLRVVAVAAWRWAA